MTVKDLMSLKISKEVFNSFSCITISYPLYEFILYQNKSIRMRSIHGKYNCRVVSESLGIISYKNYLERNL